MLDLFLEVACGHQKQAEAQAKTVALLNQLPDDVLHKIASGAILKESFGGDGDWLEKFRGTPLLDQAIAIEKEELELQMQETERRRAEDELRHQFSDYSETQNARDDLSIKRKLLELELVGGGEHHGQEATEEEAPADLEALEHESQPAKPKTPSVHEMQAERENAGAEVDNPLTDPSEADGTPFDGAAPPKAEKPKPEKVVEKTVEKPAPEKVDIKTAAAAMRFQLALEKMANPALLGSAALNLGVHGALGAAGYYKGKDLARRDQDAPEWGVGKVLGSMLITPYGAYQVGKTFGHHSQREEMYQDEQELKKHQALQAAPVSKEAQPANRARAFRK
jgi:hypothetical protein